MERGLLWLPLLGTFITLTWLGWRSFRQVESYRAWAQDFETAKYDTASVAGLKDGVLTWGKPQADGPTDLQTIALDRVSRVDLLIDDTAIAWPPQDIPTGKRFALALHIEEQERCTVPFGDIKLAVAWCKKLKQLTE